MRKAIIPLLFAGLFCSCGQQATTDTPLVKNASAETTAKPMPTEFADAKYMDMGRQYLNLLSQGKIDEWANQFDDNAVYLWSAGDSLKGKEAIRSYWLNRRSKVIDSISFMNDIWLPLKVNEPQNATVAAGTWLLNWSQVGVKYKNGKRLFFGMHNDFHYNDAGKIDRAIQYIDRAPINAALGMK